MDRIYAVAMEPERFADIVEIWNRRLAASGSAMGAGALEKHLYRAEQLLTLVDDNQDSLPEAIERRVAREPQPLIAFDREEHIVSCNTPASRAYGVAVGEGLANLPIDERARAAIRSELSRLDADAELGSAPILLRAEKTDDGDPAVMSFARWRTPGGRSLLLVKTVGFTWPDSLTPLVIRAFELTEAEADVMRQLVEGATAKDIAEARGVSLATVRSQIQSIYGKTATRNQNEFLRMAIGLTTMGLDGEQLAPKAEDRHTPAGETFPLAVHEHLLTLPDGRQLDYADFGAPDGLPCLFLHNEFFGNSWPMAMADYASARGLRIIAPARPYCGRSSPYPAEALTWQQTAEDMRFLLDHLGIERAVHLYHMAGGLFSIAFANAYPDRLAGMVILAPLFPLGSPEEEERASFFHRFLSSMIHRNKRLFEFACRSGYAFYKRSGPRRFIETFARDRPADLAVLDDESCLEAIVRGTVFCGIHGHKGFFYDYRDIPENCWEMLLAVEQPVACVVGDSVSERTNMRLEELFRAKPDVEKIVAKGGAHYVFFSHQELVVDTVCACWQRHHHN